MTKEQALKKFNEIIDDLFLYGRPVVPGAMAGAPRPSIEELRAYRRQHLSERAKRHITRLLSQKFTGEVEADDDILVYENEPWQWQHREMFIRSRCFEILDGAEVQWKEGANYSLIAGTRLPEGWLLIESKHVVGATEFESVIANGEPAWVWRWAFIDPEHRRQGIISQRLPLWVERYGKFIVDQPSPDIITMLIKTGYIKQLRFKGPHLFRSPNGITVSKEVII